jgi:hypothetical protein
VSWQTPRPQLTTYLQPPSAAAAAASSAPLAANPEAEQQLQHQHQQPHHHQHSQEAAHTAGAHFEWLQPSSRDSPAAACTALYVWRDGRALLHLQPLAPHTQHSSASPLAKSSSIASALEGGSSRTSSPAPSAAPAAGSAKATTAATAAPKKEAAGKATAGGKEGHAATVAASPQEQPLPCGALVPGARIWVLPHAITSSAISSEAGLLATGHADGSVLVWDARMGACLCELAKCATAVASLGFVPAGGCKGSSRQQQEVALLVADDAGSLVLHQQAKGAVAGVLERAWQVPSCTITSSSATRAAAPSSPSSRLLLGSARRVVCTAAPGLALLLLESRQGQAGLLWLDALRLQPLARLALPPQSAAAASAAGRLLERPGAVAVVGGRVLLAGHDGGGGAAVLLDFGPVDAMVQRVLAAAPACSQQPVGIQQQQQQEQQSEQQCSSAGAPGSCSRLRTAAQPQPKAAAVPKLLPASGAFKGSPAASPTSRCSRACAPPAACAPAGQLPSSGHSGSGTDSSAAAEDPVARALAKLKGTWGAAPEAQQLRQLKHAAAAVAGKLEAARGDTGAGVKPQLTRLLGNTKPHKQAGI